MTTTAARIAALIAAVLTTAALLLGATAATASAAPTAPVQVQEDDPAWDCATMGNRICGPQVERVEDFPGGLNVHLDSGIVLTCRDWDTTGDECNSADTVQHYLHAFDIPSDCRHENIGTPAQPWLVLVSDTTVDGLCV